MMSELSYSQSYVSLAPSATQTVTQPVSGSLRSTLGVNSLNNIYYVNQWCSTPGTLDDTCFSNAITDISSHALTGTAGRSMQVLVVSPGVYKFNNTVTVPLGMDIDIKGEYQSSVWGAVISPGTNSTVDYFHVQADNVSFQNLAFVGGTGITAITLGTSAQATFDVHINGCWFAGQNVGIHIVNGGGYDLSHNTFDGGTNYGIYSNTSGGDVSANDIIATDLRGYGQISTIVILNGGAQSSNYEGYLISGIFDHSIQGSSAISLSNVVGANISGVFNDNNYQDINVYGSTGVIISNFQVYDPGQSSIVVSESNAVQLVNGIFYNSNTITAGTPMISVTASANVTVNNLTSVNGGKVQASVGLYVDANTSASTIYNNKFYAQTGAGYEVLDPSAGLSVQGVLSASSVQAANGFTGTKTAGSCTLTITAGIITNISGC